MDKATTNTDARERALRIILAALIALSGVLMTFSQAAPSAYAAESAVLEVGGRIDYAGYNTTWMCADGEIAYCGNPSANTPPAGSYTKNAISAPSGRNAETIADLWFSYGSPGFDRSLWPSTWYDGSAMTDARYAALAHILLSDTFSSDGSYALFGCNESFKSWCRQNVIGFGADGHECNPNATGRLICARQGEVPDNFQAFMLHTGAGNQLILSFKFIPYGHIDLQKVSANPGMCEGNPLYSLAGAEYTVYRNSGLTDVAGTITTDGEGYGKLEDLDPGDYWVKETKQALGHALDPTVYKTTVVSDETTRVNGETVSDIAQSDPVGMLLGKIDSQTGEPAPQGDATLEGGLFTVRYYAGDYASAEAAEASGAPARTWVFETDVDGFAYLADECKYSGDELFRQTNGDASIPLGTILVQETRAPEGYNLDDGHGGEPEVFCIRITPDGAVGESVYTYSSPQVPDTVKRGDVRLVKEVPVTIYDETDGDMSQEVKRVLVPGVKFELYNESENPVLSPETGKLVSPGDRVCTITVDANGLATTKDENADVNGWSKPSDWTGALAYGTYRVHEVIPDDVADDFKATWGKDLLAVGDWKTSISEEGQYEPPQLVNDRIPQTPLKIVKVDAETGKHIPLPCSFKLLDGSGEPVTYTSHYPVEETVDTWTASERGELMLPMLLEYGGLHVLGAHARERVVLGAPALNLDSKRSRCCGALGQREAAREVVGGMEQRDRLFVGDALDHAAWQLLECGVGRGKEGVCRFSPVARYHLVGSAFQLAHERQVREPLLSDGFRQPCDGGFVHRVDGVSRVVFDSGQVYLEYGVALARARCIVQKPRYGESLRYVFSRGHGAPPRQERRNHAQGGS